LFFAAPLDQDVGGHTLQQISLRLDKRRLALWIVAKYGAVSRIVFVLTNELKPAIFASDTGMNHNVFLSLFESITDA
jgi:hypothetical protein